MLVWGNKCPLSSFRAARVTTVRSSKFFRIAWSAHLYSQALCSSDVIFGVDACVRISWKFFIFSRILSYVFSSFPLSLLHFLLLCRITPLATSNSELIFEAMNYCRYFVPWIGDRPIAKVLPSHSNQIVYTSKPLILKHSRCSRAPNLCAIKLLCACEKLLYTAYYMRTRKVNAVLRYMTRVSTSELYVRVEILWNSLVFWKKFSNGRQWTPELASTI